MLIYKNIGQLEKVIKNSSITTAMVFNMPTTVGVAGDYKTKCWRKEDLPFNNT